VGPCAHTKHVKEKKMSASLTNTVYNSLKRRGIKVSKQHPILDKYGMVSLINVVVLNDNGFPKALIKCMKRVKQGTSDRLLFHNFEIMQKERLPSFIITEGRKEGYTDGVLSSLKQVCRASKNVQTGKYDDFREWSKQF
jgi:hypothetical protein